MKQLALELSAPPRPTFDNFVVGRNAELLAALRALAQGAPGERFLYLWGSAGCGRSHLLRAAVAERSSRGGAASYVCAGPVASALRTGDPDGLLALDGVEALDGEGQTALFGLYNRMREGRGALIASGDAPPAVLALRAELATRLGWGLVYEVHALNDAERSQAMNARARARGYELPPEVCDYLLTHGPRDLPHVLAMVDALDRRSLELHRAVTLPLARELLRGGAEEKERK